MAPSKSAKRKRDSEDEIEDYDIPVPSIEAQPPTPKTAQHKPSGQLNKKSRRAPGVASPPTTTSEAEAASSTPHTPPRQINKKPRTAFDTASPNTISLTEAAPDTPSAIARTSSAGTNFHTTFPRLPPPSTVIPPPIPQRIAAKITQVDPNKPIIVLENYNRRLQYMQERRIRHGLWEYVRNRAAAEGTMKQEWEKSVLNQNIVTAAEIIMAGFKDKLHQDWADTKDWWKSHASPKRQKSSQQKPDKNNDKNNDEDAEELQPWRAFDKLLLRFPHYSGPPSFTSSSGSSTASASNTCEKQDVHPYEMALDLNNPYIRKDIEIKRKQRLHRMDEARIMWENCRIECSRRGSNNMTMGQWEGGDPDSWALWELREAAEAKRRSSNGSAVEDEEELEIDEAELAALRQKMVARNKRSCFQTISHSWQFDARREIGEAREVKVEHEQMMASAPAMIEEGTRKVSSGARCSRAVESASASMP
ncbi:uncharacterized protein AB675_9143 [Cyphellophora attinorum]|uniref:Uncharacterized protein n=1 Tax=Cyphellophora attinorum TaxID=1664694 RepID=A0A0N1P1E6_9EURO|nr:uncharacterized protein AB675_9143 [Phialophora attinorum]KPI41683.1 hypothetical protein AB675_9143 [Phialophora attinorum]